MTEFLNVSIAKRLWSIKDTEGLAVIESLEGMTNSLIGRLMKMSEASYSYYMSANQHGVLPGTVGQELMKMLIKLRVIKKMATDESNLRLYMNTQVDAPFLIEVIIREMLPSLDQNRKLRLTEAEADTALAQFSEQLIPGVNPKELADKICASGKSWDFIMALKKKKIVSVTLDMIREAEPQKKSPWVLACDTGLLKLLDGSGLTREIQRPGLGSGTKVIKHMPCLMTRSPMDEDGLTSDADELSLNTMKADFEELAKSFDLLATNSAALVERAQQAARKEWKDEVPEETIRKIDLDNVMAGLEVKQPADLALKLRTAASMIDHGMQELARPAGRRLLS